MKNFFPLVFIAATATAVQAAPKKIATVEGITEYRLDNGLRVLLFPDSSKPTVTVNVTYFVGSRHEGYGETGMAHLLEHMMFKGTKTRPPCMRELESRGAMFDATTSEDRTNYFEVLKAEGDNLPFALALEADRMVNARISSDDLKSEFSVVRNELEIGENQPDAVLEERMRHAAYEWHNYGKSTIGSRSDVERVPADRLRAFYKTYYRPDNAMLVVAGKIDPAQALTLVGNTFGKIARPKSALPETYTVEPVQDGERTVTLRRTGDVNLVGLVYHTPGGAHPDFVAAHAIVDMLTTEPSGRLYKSLVEPGLAAKLRGEPYPTKEPGALELFAAVRTDKSLDATRDKMIAVVEGLAQSKIGEDELERWRMRTLRDIELGLTNPEKIGLELSEWAAQGDWRMKFVFRDRVKALTVADVRRVAAQYLKQSNRTVGEFIVTAKPDRAPSPDTPDVAKTVADYKGRAEIDKGETFAGGIDEIEKRTERLTLPSGLKLVLLPKKTRGGAVELMLSLRAGNEKDLKGLTNVARLMRDMVLRGSKKHTYEQIVDELARLKADLKPSMTNELGADFAITTVRQSVPAVLALLGEIVREPRFDKAELEKLRKEQLAHLESRLQQPMSIGARLLAQKAWPWPKDDPRYVESVAEQIEHVKAVRNEQLADFHRTFWGAGGGTLVLVGDFDANDVKRVAGEQLGAWRAPNPWRRMPLPYHAGVASSEIVRTADKANAVAATALVLELRDDDPDFPAVQLGAYIYGGGSRSRIWDRLREREGLSYGAYAGVVADAFDKLTRFQAFAQCAPQNASKALAGLVEEMQKLASEPIKTDELEQAKRAYLALFDNQLSDDGALAELLTHAAQNERTLTFEAGVNGKIRALKAGEVENAFKKWLRTDGLSKVLVGDLPN